MKPELTPELMDWLKGAAEKSAEFVQREAPLLAGEIVAWHYWSSVYLAVIFGMAAMAVIGIGLSIMVASFKGSGDGDGCFLGLVIALLGVIVGCAGVGDNTYEACKAKVAPRVVILEAIQKASK